MHIRGSHRISRTRNCQLSIVVEDDKSFLNEQIQKVGGDQMPELSTVVPQHLQHTFASLFWSEKVRGNLAVFIPVDQHVLRRRDQTVLNSAVPSQ